MDREQTTAPLTDKSDADAKGKYSGPPKWRSSRFILAYMIMMGNAVVFFQRVSFSMVIVCMVNHTALAPTARLPDNGSDGQGAHSTSSPLGSNLTLSFLATTHRDMTWQGDDDVVFNETGDGAGGGRPGLQGGQHCDIVESPSAGHEEKEDGPFVWDKATQGLLLGAVYWGYMVAQVIAAYFIYFFGPRRVCMVSVFIMSALTVLCHPAALWSPWAVFTLRVLVGICTVRPWAVVHEPKVGATQTGDNKPRGLIR
ncbi:hypothetical protein V1264_008725 [Littorina saxatilis]|uniref:Uncharacterized protein n=1 Tax=Littorina saxatilis TaxID=31220 RepID=A0AAN9AU11_9CAEN